VVDIEWIAVLLIVSLVLGSDLELETSWPDGGFFVAEITNLRYLEQKVEVPPFGSFFTDLWSSLAVHVEC
jgi:hypothetical protein